MFEESFRQNVDSQGNLCFYFNLIYLLLDLEYLQSFFSGGILKNIFSHLTQLEEENKYIYNVIILPYINLISKFFEKGYEDYIHQEVISKICQMVFDKIYNDSENLCTKIVDNIDSDILVLINLIIKRENESVQQS